MTRPGASYIWALVIGSMIEGLAVGVALSELLRPELSELKNAASFSAAKKSVW
jgi:hypothetical protein